MLSIQDLQSALTWRYAVKDFKKGVQVESDKVQAILEAGRMAPNAYGLQPHKLIHVKNPEMRAKLLEVSFGQTKVVDAGDLFVVAVRTDINENFINEYVNNVSETRGVSTDDLKGYRDMMIGDILGRDEVNKSAWAGRMAYISLGFILEAAALLEVDLCPMEGILPGKYDEILGLKEMNLQTLSVFAVGVREESDVYATMKKVRVSSEDFVIET